VTINKIIIMSKKNNKVINVYVLELEQNKYYVGRTDKPLDYSTESFKRIEEHFKGKGSKWTKEYKPIKILEIIQNCHPRYEDYMTKILMDTYGEDNVRGGTYCRIELTFEEKIFLHREKQTSENRCFSCNEHYQKMGCACKQNGFSDNNYKSMSKKQQKKSSLIQIINNNTSINLEKPQQIIYGNNQNPQLNSQKSPSKDLNFKVSVNMKCFPAHENQPTSKNNNVLAKKVNNTNDDNECTIISAYYNEKNDLTKRNKQIDSKLLDNNRKFINNLLNNSISKKSRK